MTVEKLDLSADSLLQRPARSPFSDAIQQLLKNRAAVLGGLFIILITLIAIFADTFVFTLFTGAENEPFIAPHHYAAVDFKLTDDPPGTRSADGEKLYIMGTDYLGRDNLSRTLYGARISLAVAIVAAIVNLLFGLVYGLVSGYGGSRLDNGMMRFVDFLYGFPGLIFIILMQVYFKALGRQENVGGIADTLISMNKAMGGILFVFIAIGLISWLGMARLARGQTLSIKNKEFVEAARAIGSPHRRIIFRHILPNILGPCIVAETLAIPGYILTEAFLSFIGLGADPPTPSWGMMISETYNAIRVAPWEAFTPAIALTLTTLAFNFLGDGLRDAFDPRLRE